MVYFTGSSMYGMRGILPTQWFHIHSSCYISDWGLRCLKH
jgi:hypothetical protein